MPTTVLKSSIPAILAELTPALSKVVGKTAESIVERAREAMRESDATGEDSERGEAPAIDTGELYNSGVVGVDGLTAEAGFTAPHAVKLEMEMGRPFLTPAAEEERPSFYGRVGATMAGVSNRHKVV